jgi:hypothetical protein
VQRLTPEEQTDPRVWRANLGLRATLRYRLKSGAAHPYSDAISEAIGAIQTVEPDGSGNVCVTVVSRRGEARIIPVSDIIAAKIL